MSHFLKDCRINKDEEVNAVIVKYICGKDTDFWRCDIEKLPEL